MYRRLEARGEVRGGRFVSGVSGEQFALPEAVGQLRSIRRQERKGELISISAADPLNLTGILTPGERIPALTTNRILYRDGLPVGIQLAGAPGQETVLFETGMLVERALDFHRSYTPLARAETGAVSAEARR